MGEDRISNTISIDTATRVQNHDDQLTRASDSQPFKKNTFKNTSSPTLQSANAHQPRDAPNILPSTETKSQPQHIRNAQEYVVDWIVRHIGKQPNFKHAVRWYGYEASGDTVHPPENLPAHFVARYWRTVGNKSK